ncbi:hypothetical protein [Rhodocytophaga rosea]|nr:hypothetical protein [Rhodocytophaga rosea]
MKALLTFVLLATFLYASAQSENSNNIESMVKPYLAGKNHTIAIG